MIKVAADGGSDKTAWYTIFLLRYSTITDNNPSIHLPSIMIHRVYSNQCCKYPHLSDVLFYRWHLLHYCPSWERDPSHVALSEVSTFFLPVKRFFSSFSFLLLRVKGRGCHTLCDLWIWAVQIKFDWLIDWLILYTGGLSLCCQFVDLSFNTSPFIIQRLLPDMRNIVPPPSPGSNLSSEEINTHSPINLYTILLMQLFNHY